MRSDFIKHINIYQIPANEGLRKFSNKISTIEVKLNFIKTNLDNVLKNIYIPNQIKKRRFKRSTNLKKERKKNLERRETKNVRGRPISKKNIHQFKFSWNKETNVILRPKILWKVKFNNYNNICEVLNTILSQIRK